MIGVKKHSLKEWIDALKELDDLANDAQELINDMSLHLNAIGLNTPTALSHLKKLRQVGEILKQIRQGKSAAI
ncbi:hypothetical protein [Campylobacter majalis]|uniref:hypothetical protein n=1 Tax=Campylobacter majalis TaxID=2790656 RepID=UPI003D684616